MNSPDGDPQEVQKENTAGEADPKPEEQQSRKRRGWRLPLILIIPVLLAAGGAGIWNMQAPMDLSRFIDDTISAVTGRLQQPPPPGDQSSGLPLAVQVETTGTGSANSESSLSTPEQAAGAPGPAAGELFELLTARLDAQEDRLDGLADSVNQDMPGVAQRLDGMKDEISRLSDAIRGQEEQLGELDSSLVSVRDRAQAAGREASHVRNQLNLINSDSASSSKMLEADLKAVITSLDSVRTQQFNLSGRIEALAGDLHLMSRYGYGQQAEPTPQRSAVIHKAPGQNMLSAPSGSSLAQPPSSAAPPDLVQGRYRVGDWVGGYGVVSSIRKTPEGDHLVTPGGVLFAPAVPATEGAGGG